MNKIIYCLVSLKTNHEKLNVLLVGMKGISGGDLSVITFDKITAVVSDIKDTNIIADRSNAIKFAEVIDTLAQQFTLLPLRYGSIMESASINKMIERNYQEFQQNLKKVENKVEYGLKVFCDSEKLKLELSEKSEANIQKSEKPSQNIKNSVYRDYIDKKHKEHKLEELLLAYVDMIIQEITKHLEQLNPIHTFKKMGSKTNIINAVFLLEKDKKEGLINIVKDIQNNYTGLNLILTGPWPPYNFVDITIK